MGTGGNASLAFIIGTNRNFDSIGSNGNSSKTSFNNHDWTCVNVHVFCVQTLSFETSTEGQSFKDMYGECV